MATVKRIGILGSGDVGQSLGTGFARHGWDVKLGTREPKGPKLAPWLKQVKGTASVGTFAEAARHGEVAILAVLGTAAESALDLAGPGSFDGKLLLDATNALDFSKGMPPGLFVGTTDSLAERVQRKVPKAKVVKCFNTVPHVQMVDPKFKDGVPPPMICGNDEAAKKRTEGILREIGWPGALDVGDLTSARWLEAIVPLWVRVGMKLGTWSHAWKVVT